MGPRRELYKLNPGYRDRMADTMLRWRDGMWSLAYLLAEWRAIHNLAEVLEGAPIGAGLNWPLSLAHLLVQGRWTIVGLPDTSLPGPRSSCRQYVRVLDMPGEEAEHVAPHS